MDERRKRASRRKREQTVRILVFVLLAAHVAECAVCGVLLFRYRATKRELEALRAGYQALKEQEGTAQDGGTPEADVQMSVGQKTVRSGVQDARKDTKESGRETEDGRETAEQTGTGDGQEIEKPETEQAETEAESERTDVSEAEVSRIVREMTAEEKVAQLFMITPEALTGVSQVVAAGDTTKAALDACPVGGLIYFAENVQSEEQFAQMTQRVQQFGRERIGLPILTGIDEEGGAVVRISGRGFPGVPEEPEMYQIGSTGDCAQAYQAGAEIGGYLGRFGINVDFAPVADVWSNPENTVIGTRAFGSDARLTADMVSEAVRGLREQGICATLKHFPGHGDTSQDSHSGSATSWKRLEELRECEFLPFQAGIAAGAELVMMGHISLPNVTEDGLPASLSYTLVTEVLRNELGYEGVIITDAMNMGAISNIYGSGEAAVKAVLAGVDMILMPADFHTAYTGVLSAVENGTISEARLNESVARIVRLKKRLETGG